MSQKTEVYAKRTEPKVLLERSPDQYKSSVFIGASEYDKHAESAQAFTGLKDHYKEWLSKTFGGIPEAQQIQWGTVNSASAFEIPTKSGNGSIFDCDNVIRTLGSLDEEIEMAVKLARAKGWVSIQLSSGDVNAKKRAWVAAIQAGYKVEQVRGYDYTKADFDEAYRAPTALSIVVASSTIVPVQQGQQSSSGSTSMGSAMKPTFETKKKRGGPRV